MDFQTIIIIVGIVLLVAYLMNRNQSNAVNGNNQQQGNERPSYDDPDVQGQGSFGRDRSNRSSSENRRSISNSDATEPSSRNDAPNVQGQGSFGRNKDSIGRMQPNLGCVFDSSIEGTTMFARLYRDGDIVEDSPLSPPMILTIPVSTSFLKHLMVVISHLVTMSLNSL